LIAYDPLKRNGDLDEFITPPLLITKAVELAAKHTLQNYASMVLDPCCNLGQWGEPIKQSFPGCTLTGVEIMDVPLNSSYEVQYTNQDFLTWQPTMKYDLIIGNPPYSITVDGKRKVICDSFVSHSLSMLNSGGTLLFILRKGFNHSLRVWRDILLKEPPKYEYLCLPRPNFYGDHDRRTLGNSGAKWDYSVMIWFKNYAGNTEIVPFFWKK